FPGSLDDHLPFISPWLVIAFYGQCTIGFSSALCTSCIIDRVDHSSKISIRSVQYRSGGEHPGANNCPCFYQFTLCEYSFSIRGWIMHSSNSKSKIDIIRPVLLRGNPRAEMCSMCMRINKPG